ncbi:MAG: amylo-alpha-1,6-glucosidase [Methanomicrobiales archaeon]|nr:amylo-alpha-1,6-glucosidase [Methanomicrobiales archaeon]
MICFGREIQDCEFARQREYLLTAEGGYCSSSLAGNTRKYHGLLVHGGRVLLSSMDEYLNGNRISIASYHGTTRAEGLTHLLGFTLYPLCFQYEVGGVLLEKTIRFDGTLTIEYRCTGDGSLRILPLVTDRGIHEVRDDPWFPVENKGGEISVGNLRLRARGMDFTPSPLLYYGAWFVEDFKRGYACQENLFSPGSFCAEGRDLKCTLMVAANGGSARDTHDEIPRTNLEVLKHASSTFFHGNALIAGYHWFTEPWGRDAFVSLPGLLLLQGRIKEAEAVFRYFASRTRQGLVPNRVPDSYNSSDASLWFLRALKAYYKICGENRFFRDMREKMEEILHEYVESDVAVLDHDLIRVAPRSTWMDTAFTPREGKPVEVNALWIETLEFAEAIGVDTPVPSRSAKRRFLQFWNAERGCLFDTIDPESDEIRPNQVIALSAGLFDRDRVRLALETVKRHLLTPFGLRTLSPEDPNYRGSHTGDESYHNGSVWPWLTTFYVEACLNAGEDPLTLRMLYHPILMHLREAGLGSISELFDGDYPHRPGGCISQAWSVGEVLRGIALLHADRERPRISPQ